MLRGASALITAQQPSQPRARRINTALPVATGAALGIGNVLGAGLLERGQGAQPPRNARLVIETEQFAIDLAGDVEVLARRRHLIRLRVSLSPSITM